MAFHDEVTGTAALHPVWIAQPSDPGAIGAGKLWLDTTAGTSISAGAILKERDGTNSTWTTRLSATFTDAELVTSDITTNNVSISKHGFAPKAPNDATKFLDGTGAYSTPGASSFSGILTIAHGGTGVDLSATGAAHSFVKQSSSGANLTVGTIAVADLPAMASSDFASVCTDETGSGNLVFASAPTLSNPVVGTQSAHDNSTKGASTAYVDTPEQWVALTDGATITWDVGGRREAKGSVTLGGSRTLSITNAVNGSAGVIRVTQDGTGSRGLTLPSGSKIVGGGGTTAPLSTAASTVDLLAFEYDGTNYWWTIGKAAA